MIYETFREAVQNIWSNKFRTFLTMLGIIISVTAVIVIVGLGNGMTQSITSSFADLGTNIISVQVMGYGSRSVKVEDVYSLVDAHPDLFEAVSPTASINGTVKVGTTSYSNTSVKGVSESYLGMSGYTVRVGRGINYVDLTDNKKICVVGDYISRVAYGGNAVGQTIKIGSEKYTIVGVLEAKVTDTSDQEGSSDDIVLLPYTTALRVSKTSTASSYAVTVTSEDNISEAKTVLENGLQELLNSDEGYMVTSMSEMLDMMTSMVNMVVTILTAIAAISLLVGGIGIMNIMMVSVTERTREIGHADAHRQQQCEKSFFHSCLLNFGLALRESSDIAPLQADRVGERVISHSAALRWGSAGPHALRAGSRTAHRCPPKCQRPQPPSQWTATQSFPYRS